MLRGRGRRLWVSVLYRNDVLDTGIWWREKNSALQLSQKPLHIWRQLHQMVFSGNSPSRKKKSLKFLSQSLFSVRSPAISAGTQQYTVLMSAKPRLNHYFFLCSSAHLMIRGSQGLILNFKTRKMPLWCSISARLWLSNTFVYHCRINYHPPSI